MSLEYDLYETPDIQQTGEQQPLHPRVVFKGTIGREGFLDRVHEDAGLSRRRQCMAMQSFQDELRDLLADGWIVEMGEMGYFSVSLQGPPVMNKKDVHAQSIKLKNINYRPSSRFKKEVHWKIKPERGESFTRPNREERDAEKCLKIINSHLAKYPCLTRADYCRLTGCSKKLALKELNGFIADGLLIRYGAGKQVVYGKVQQ